MEHSYLLSLLKYCPEKGNLIWNCRRPKVKFGAVAGTVGKKGYRVIEIDGKQYAAHRLVWFYFNRKFPKEMIDHKNRKKDDNRIENLRECTNGQNRANSKTSNKTGFKGVVKRKHMKKWSAQIRHNGIQYDLGVYETAEKAHDAYCRAARILHGDFFNHG